MAQHTEKTVSAADMDGQCPVQWYGYKADWLVYFRARDGWYLYAWAPHEYTRTGDPRHDVQTRPTIDDFDAHKLIEDGIVLATGEQMEMPDDGEAHWYEGWWSHEYAAAVCNAALAHVPC